MQQFMLTPAAGKRLLGKALAVHPAVKNALRRGTIIIIAGTTNGYVAEEILCAIGQENGFSRRRFFRGINLPPHHHTTNAGKLNCEAEFPGDVVISNGIWQRGKTIFDVAGGLREGDVIIKGANALDLIHKRAAVTIANPQGGTTGAILTSIKEYQVQLLIPVGLEKRITGDLDQLTSKINSSETKSLRLFPLPGEVITEIEALYLLTGVQAEIFAAGGVSGAEGCLWLAISGSPEQESQALQLLQSMVSEPPFTV